MTRIIEPIPEPIPELIPEPLPEPSGATYEKIDEFTVRRVKAVVTESVSTDFDLDFLYQQEIEITRQRDALISAKTRELAEVREAIREAEAAGVKRRPVEAEPVAEEGLPVPDLGGERIR